MENHPVISLCCYTPASLLLGYPPLTFTHSQGNKWGYWAASVPVRSPGGWQCNQCLLLIKEVTWTKLSGLVSCTLDG